VCLKAKKETFKMGLIGLATELLVLPVIVLFCITIIGIPIGLVAIPLVMALAMLLGYTGIGLAVGERFTGGSNGGVSGMVGTSSSNGVGKSVYWSVVVGLLILQALLVISALVRLPGGVIGMIGWVIAFVGWAVVYVAVTVGLGAVVMTRFGTRSPLAAGPQAAAPFSSGPAAPQPPTPPSWPSSPSSPASPVS
jgi:hypothetical protein